MLTRGCFTCNEVGHQSYRCPKWIKDKGRDKRVNLTHEEPKEEEESRTILALLKEGECFLVGRGKPHNPSIFRSNCLIQGKVCQFIIDSRASHNVVSHEVVRKLNLKMFPHPQPYYATWVNMNQNMPVSDQVMIEFSIRKYRDKVWCDVLYMSCGNLILGRSWQWSRKVIHDGFTNKYLVHHEGRRYELQPLLKEQEEPIVMCFGQEMNVQVQYDTGWYSSKGTQSQSS